MVFIIKKKRRHHDPSPDLEPTAEPRSRKKILLVVLLFILLASNLFLLKQLMNSRKTVLYQQQVLMSVQEPPDANSEVQGKWYGLCEKNSIYSIQDFKDTVENDAILKEHFSDFDWKNASMGKLENSLWTHIAYRNNNKISTTRRAIRLPKGDGYITDGKRWLRTYCCNDYVNAASPLALANYSESVASPSRLMTGPEAELDKMINNPEKKTVEKKKEFAVVPEPPSLLLLGVGIGLLVLLKWRRHLLPAQN